MDSTDLTTATSDPSPALTPVLCEAARTQQAWAPEESGFGVEPTYFGFVEALSLRGGLSGWVAGLNPQEAVVVALLVDGVEVARTRARTSRDDIWQPNQVDFFTGFCFELEDMLPLLAMTDLSPAEPLAVNIADTYFGLSLARPWTAGDLLALLQAEQANARIESSIVNLPPNLALSRLTRLANRLLTRPLRTDRSQSGGVIEYIGVLAEEYLVLGGWWQRSQASATPAVLVSNQQKAAAGLYALNFPRPDLDDRHCGFVAVLQVQGGLRITEVHPQFTLALGEGQGLWLSTLPSLRVLTPEAAMTELGRTAEADGGTHALALQTFAREVSPWVRLPAAEGTGVSIGIDSFYLAPGFGVFISGWVLSAMGTLTDLAVQLGGSTCLLDPATLTLSARPDLGQAVPHMADRTRSAGFSALLRGNARLDVSRRWLLRLAFSDRSTVFHDVPMDRARLIDTNFDLAPLGDARFGLSDAPWLTEFVEAVYGWDAPVDGVSGGLTAASQAQTSEPQSVVIQALPESAYGLRLVLDQLSQHLKFWADQTIGLILLMPKSAPVGFLQSWLSHMAKWHPTLSIRTATLPSGANSWQALPDALRRLQVDRFAFLGTDVVLTQSGAQALPDVLSGGNKGPTFLAVEHLAGSAQPLISREAQAFVCRTDAFLQFRDQAPALVGGFFERNGMDRLALAADLAPQPGAHARRLKALRNNMLVRRINRRLLQA